MEIIFAESITLPPPTASIISGLKGLARAAASSTSSIIGLGFIPSNSKTSVFMVLRIAFISS